VRTALRLTAFRAVDAVGRAPGIRRVAGIRTFGHRIVLIPADILIRATDAAGPRPGTAVSERGVRVVRCLKP
jgi:hypothetical protein